MASQIPISEVVDLTISLTGGATPIENFGMPLIVDTQNILVSGSPGAPVIRTYTSLASMISDGFVEYTKAYKLATSMLTQSPPPKTWKVASVSALSNTSLTAVENGDATWYAMLLTSRASADIQTVATWAETVATRKHLYFAESQDAAVFTGAPNVLTTLRTASRKRTCAFGRKANQQAVTLTISKAFSVGATVTVKVNGVSIGPVVWNATSDTTLADLATALAAATPIDTATVTTVAGGTENDRAIVCTAADPLVDIVFSDFADGGGSPVTASFEITNAGAIPADAGALGILLPFGLGQTALHGRAIAGLEVDNLTLDELNYVTGNGGNVYVSIGSHDMAQKGQVCGKTAQGNLLFVDTIAAVDRLESEILNAMVALLIGPTPVPFNNQGIGLVAGALGNAAQQMVNRGMFEPFNFKSAISYPDISTISAADKAARRLSGIIGSFVATGAVQSIGLNVSVQV